MFLGMFVMGGGSDGGSGDGGLYIFISQLLDDCCCSDVDGAGRGSVREERRWIRCKTSMVCSYMIYIPQPSVTDREILHFLGGGQKEEGDNARERKEK